MRILQVITLSELGGAQTVVANLSNVLIQNHEVIVAAGEGDGKMWKILDKRIIKHQCKNLRRKISPKDDLLTLIEFRRMLIQYKPDVIHLHSSKAGLLGRIAFPSNKIVYTVHGFDSIRVAHRKLLPVEKIMQYLCASIVGVSKYDYNNLLKEGVFRNTSFVYNGIPRFDEKELPELDCFRHYKKIILTIARVAPPKRHDIFIEASKRLPQYGFIWIGNQNEINDLPKNCHFVGNIENAGAYCKFADLFCLPSDYEGLPMVILEAMSCGKPILASNVGGINEIVKDQVNGYVLENTVDDFVNKIEYVLSDSSILQDMGVKSKEIFEKYLTIEKMVEGYMEFYQTIYESNR